MSMIGFKYQNAIFLDSINLPTYWAGNATGTKTATCLLRLWVYCCNSCPTFLPALTNILGQWSPQWYLNQAMDMSYMLVKLMEQFELWWLFLLGTPYIRSYSPQNKLTLGIYNTHIYLYFLPSDYRSRCTNHWVYSPVQMWNSVFPKNPPAEQNTKVRSWPSNFPMAYCKIENKT